MISIKANGTFLTIDPASGIDYTIVNSFFDNDLMEQEFSLPFTLPMDPVNKAALGFRDRLDGIPVGSVIPCTVYFLNAPRLEADLYVLRGSDEALEVNIKSRIMGILDLLDDTPLRDLMPEIEVPDVLEDYQGIIIEPMLQLNNACRVYLDGREFRSVVTLDKDLRGSSLADEINEVYPGSTTYNATTNRLTIMPTWSPVNYSFHDSEVIIVHSFETPSQYWYRNFHAWAQQVNADTAADYCFPLIFNRGYYAENPIFTGAINPPFPEYGEHGDLYAESTSWKYSYSPWTKILSALDYIAAGVDNLDAFLGPVMEDEDVQRLITSNIKPLDEVTREIYPDDWSKLGQGDDNSQPSYEDVPLHLNHFKQRFNLGDFIGDMTAKDFVYLVADSLRLQMTYRDNIIYFRKKITTVTAAIARDLPRFRGRPVIEYGDIVDFTLHLYRPDPEKDKTEWPESLGPIDVGNGGTPRTLTHGTLPMSTPANLFIGDGPTYPIINILNTDLPNGNQGLFLLFYHGIQTLFEEIDYPFASNSYLNDSDVAVGDMSLDLQDAKSIYIKYLQGTFQFDVSDTITDGGLYSPYEIDEASWFRARVKGYSERGEYAGIIRSINMRITARGEMEATFELAKQRI